MQELDKQEKRHMIMTKHGDMGLLCSPT